MLRHRFGVALESRLGGFPALNTIARLLVLTSRSVGSRASPGWSQTQTRRSGPNTCREATHLSRAFLMQATTGTRSGRLGLQYGIPRGAIGGRGTSETTVKPKRGKPSLVESYVTPSPGVGWLQARGRTTPVKRPFHPTRHWHCLSKPSPRFQVSTLTG